LNLTSKIVKRCINIIKIDGCAWTPAEAQSVSPKHGVHDVARICATKIGKFPGVVYCMDGADYRHIIYFKTGTTYSEYLSRLPNR
jgi:hypothetical protein